MIRLNVEEYCQECPEFMPWPVRSEYGYANEEYSHCDTTIVCEHRARCAIICQQIRKSENEKI